MIGLGNRVFRTDTAPSSTSPQWLSRFNCEITLPNDLHFPSYLFIAVYDSSTFRSDDLMGYGFLSLEHVLSITASEHDPNLFSLTGDPIDVWTNLNFVGNGMMHLRFQITQVNEEVLIPTDSEPLISSGLSLIDEFGYDVQDGLSNWYRALPYLKAIEDRQFMNWMNFILDEPDLFNEPQPFGFYRNNYHISTLISKVLL